ncbi:uncharacterized protein Z520_11880 [Fonsecaea multimorphosa CBS 102226]|uniref:F-box domain-containing protein n=1 Tax=Fonsecaea multimorphosa CBS 102226 TaxID=1442371 RepID=A0A0D2GSI0_9EURO|nr:uncharacterized protein Z520_11880 [Fonsecaea multimorphosa CBS 102226]KIX92405.1 hypothetical protein Z520_11880 [Fonsecaea multimorphosa CBS 102226]OAL17776.1 hypothetical protein AYO22_11304 [Fonsecaea multimorphosa]
MTLRANHLYCNGPEVQGAFGVDTLPLTTVAHIISYLDDDVASLARLCRTSRVLWYMTLPHLWKNVTLKSYSTIRYKGELPEGFGSASPFSMGLNALVTRNVSSLVRSLSLDGEYSALDLHEYSRAGRVSESIMVLNIALRAAIDQCTHLERFRWDLDVRLQPNMYAGLAKLSRLEELWLRFPTNRSPQPAYDIPPLPNLKTLTLTHYDPLCFPDDFSTLLLHATRLSSLLLHFSPRMREQGEPSVVLSHFFRKLTAANRRLRLRKMGVYNLLANADTSECLAAFDTSTIEDITVLNTFGLDEDVVVAGRESATHFIDRTWHMMVNNKDPLCRPKSLRMDQLHKRHAMDLAQFVGLERLYLVNARYKPSKSNSTVADCNGQGRNNGAGTSDSDASSAEHSPWSSSVGNGTASARSTPNSLNPCSATISLRDLYINNICNICGPTLQHLILPSRWPLTAPITARLIRSCPNLTQLAASIECTEESQMEMLRLLMPFLSELWAIRALLPSYPPDVVAAGGEDGRKSRDAHERFENLPDCVHEQKINEALSEHTGSGGNEMPELRKLKYIGLGSKVWEISGVMEEVIRGGRVDAGGNGVQEVSSNGNGYRGEGDESKKEIVYRRRARRIQEKDVQHVEIWKMDTLDIV